MSNEALARDEIISQCSMYAVRAQAIIDLLIENGDSLENGFRMNHEVICNALWAIEGCLDDIKRVTTL